MSALARIESKESGSAGHPSESHEGISANAQAQRDEWSPT